MWAQERPATLILTVTSRLHLMLVRCVYNRDAETGNWKFVLQLRTIRMRKICQSHQFVIWDPSFCHPSVTPVQTFAGRKLKTRRLSMMFSFSPELELGIHINLYSFESSIERPFRDIFSFRLNKNFWLHRTGRARRTHASQKSLHKPWLGSDITLLGSIAITHRQRCNLFLNNPALLFLRFQRNGRTETRIN